MSQVTLRGVEGVGVVGSSQVFPAGRGRVVGNDEVHALVHAAGGTPAPEDWLTTMGFDTRWWTAEPGGSPYPDAPSTEELLTEATAAALDDAGLTVRDVDVVVAATTTPSRLTSAMATVTSGRLGIRGAAFDVRAGCASTLHGLTIAFAMLDLGAEVAVVTGAETLSRVAPVDGWLPYVAGDAAGAVVLARVDTAERGLVGGVLDSDGGYSDDVGVPGVLPPTADDVERDRYRLRLGREVGAAAADCWPHVTTAALAAAGTAGASVSALVANQPNRPRLLDAASAGGIDPASLVDVVDRTANAGAASFLVSLDEARRTGRASTGMPVLCVAVGGGLNWGGLVLRP